MLLHVTSIRDSTRQREVDECIHDTYAIAQGYFYRASIMLGTSGNQEAHQTLILARSINPRILYLPVGAVSDGRNHRERESRLSGCIRLNADESQRIPVSLSFYRPLLVPQ